MFLQQWLTRLFNNHWHECSTVAGKIVQQSLARLFSHWQNSSTVAGTITKSQWHDCSTVTGMIVHQSLAWLLNSHWHNGSTVTGTILHQSLARLFHCHGQIFSFFYAGRILQQWRSLLKNRAMYQKYGTWSEITFNYFKLQSFIKSSHHPDIWYLYIPVDMYIDISYLYIRRKINS